MNTQGWIAPGSEADQVLTGFDSVCRQMLDPKHRKAFISEAMLSDMIKEVHELTVQLLAHLTDIENEAQARASIEELAERLGGFA